MEGFIYLAEYVEDRFDEARATYNSGLAIADKKGLPANDRKRLIEIANELETICREPNTGNVVFNELIINSKNMHPYDQWYVAYINYVESTSYKFYTLLQVRYFPILSVYRGTYLDISNRADFAPIYYAAQSLFASLRCVEKITTSMQQQIKDLQAENAALKDQVSSLDIEETEIMI